MGISALQERVTELTERSRFQSARPFLLEIVNRLEDGTAEERESLGPVFFFLGLGYLQEYSQAGGEGLLEEAAEAFTKALGYGVEEEREISLLEFRGDAYRGLGKFEEAVADYRKLVSDPLVRRLRPEDERDILQKLALSYQSLKKWRDGLPWLRRFFDRAEGDEQRALAAGLLLEAYIATGNTRQVLDLLPLITVDNPSRYSVALNVALMKAGDSLAERGRYAEAALLYNATLTREQIVRYFEEREKNLAERVERLRALGRSEERLADELFELENARLQLEAVRQVEAYTSQLMARVARNYYLAGRDFEAIWAYLRYVENYPNDPLSAEFSFAAFITATKVGLDDLARRLGEEILEGGTQNEDFRKRVLISLASAYLESGDEDEFRETVDEFLDRFPDSAEAGQIVFLVGNHLVNENRLEELIDRFSARLEQLEGTPAEPGLHYWMGLALLFQGEFARARGEFETVLDEERFPDTVYREDSAYRRAMTFYGEDEVEKARAAFRAFVEDYPRGELRGEVEFFLGEIAASNGELIEAVEHYETVPEYSENIDYITSAYFQKARLLERNDILKRAAATYQEYIDRYAEEGRLTRAIYLLGEVLKKRGRPGEALTRYLRAILRYGNNPDNLGVDPMIDDYVRRYDETLRRLNATVNFLQRLEADEEFRRKVATDRGFLYQQFSDNPDLDRTLYEEMRKSEEFSRELAAGPGPILPFLESYRQQLDDFPNETPGTIFSREYEQARRSGRRTLAMRLQMALETLNQPPADPMVIQESDIDRASPRMLVWIGKQKERVDPGLARKAYREALDYPEMVPAKVDAYLNLADMLRAAGATDEALELYAEAEENYPANPEIYRALIAQAEILTDRGRPAEAREKLLRILKTPEWRGEPHAEALYRTGMTYFDEGMYPEAHGFFERTFLGYALFKEWAARAYLMDARTLAQMGRMEDARNTLREALSDDRFSETPIYSELVEYANNI